MFKVRTFEKNHFFLQKWQFLPAEGRLPRYNIYMKIISIAQTLAVWQVDRTQKIGKFSSFWEPGFQKFIPPKLIFLVDLKYVIWFCLAFWETGESTYISSGSEDFFFRFSESLNLMTEGGGVHSKSCDYSTSLWNTYKKKVGKFTPKQKKIWSFGVPEKKSNIKRFFDIFGLVRDVRQFKNKLKRWLKTALLFFFVSYCNFF